MSKKIVESSDYREVAHAGYDQLVAGSVKLPAHKSARDLSVLDWFQMGGDELARRLINRDIICFNYRSDQVISGFSADPQKSIGPKKAAAGMFSRFMPGERLDLVNQLTDVVASFAALAGSRSVALRFEAGGNPVVESAKLHGREAYLSDSGLAVGFTVADSSQLRGFYAIKGSGPLIAAPGTYNEDDLTAVIADRLSGVRSDAMEAQAFVAPEGTLTLWRGLTSEFPAIVAHPRRRGESYITLQMKALGDGDAHRNRPGLLQAVGDALIANCSPLPKASHSSLI